MSYELSLRLNIVNVAASYVNTPYIDRSWVKGEGVDCATFAMMVYQEVELVPQDYKLPIYFPQQWCDRRKEDTTYLDEVMRFAVEISEGEEKPGDLMLYKILKSYTHGAIIVNDSQIYHTFRNRWVMLGDRFKDQALKRRQKRFFSFVLKFMESLDGR